VSGVPIESYDDLTYFIGNRADLTRAWHGYLDDIRVYSSQLHAMDALTIYNNTKSSDIFWDFGSEQTQSVLPGGMIIRQDIFWFD
jgi:hypothetical protein